MDLWIRSQDKKLLVGTNEVEWRINSFVGENDKIDKNGNLVVCPKRTIVGYTFYANGTMIAEYKTEEKAREILNTLKKLLSKCDTGIDRIMPVFPDLKIKLYPREMHIVYEMPADNEVEAWEE